MEIELWPRDLPDATASRIALVVLMATADAWTATQLRITGSVAGTGYTLTLGVGAIQVPIALLELLPGLPNNAELHRIKSPGSALRDATDEARQRWQDAYGQLRAALASVQCVAAGGGTLDFLGAKTIAGAAIAVTARIDLDALIDQRPGAWLIEVEALATLAALAHFAGPVSLSAAARLTLSIDPAWAPWVLPTFESRSFPDLSFAWPRLPGRVTGSTLSLLATLGTAAADIENGMRTAVERLFDQSLLGPFVHVQVTTAPTLAIAIDGTGDLTIATTAPGAIDVMLSGQTRPADPSLVAITGVTLSLATGRFGLNGNLVAQASHTVLSRIDLPPAATGPYAVTLQDVDIDVTATLPAGAALSLAATVTIGRCEIRARSDPSLVLAFGLGFVATLEGGVPRMQLTQFTLIDPSPCAVFAAIAKVVDDEGRALWSLIQRVPVSAPVPAGVQTTLRRIGELLAAGAAWVQQGSAEGARALGGLAESALSLAGRAIDAMLNAIATAGTAVYDSVAIEWCIDLTRRAIVRVVVTPYGTKVATAPIDSSIAGLSLSVPAALMPALICDFDQGWTALALVPPEATPCTLKLSTDLWLDDAASSQRVTGDDPAAPPQTPSKPLITLEATSGAAAAVALVVVQDGRPQFFVPLAGTPVAADIEDAGGQVVIATGTRLLASKWTLNPTSDPCFSYGVSIDINRILSLFRLPAPATDGASGFMKSIKVKAQSVPATALGAGNVIGVDLDVIIDVSEFTEVTGPGAVTALETTLRLTLDPRTLSARLSGGRIGITRTDPMALSLLGLSADITPLRPGEPYTPFQLVLGDGNPRLAFDPTQATFTLHYDKLSSGGRPLKFDVTTFAIGGDGMDLDASVSNDPVVLAGIDMPFRFTQGKLSVRRGRVQAVLLAGSGNLPPALVGEAKASILLSFTHSREALVLQSCEAILDKGKDPLRCESTRFTLTIEKLGLKVVEQGGYHFYFTLTGSAVFRPVGDEFADGLLKNLSNVQIVLDEAPLAGDPSVLLQHIEFLVPITPPAHVNLFNVFDFQLRGVGFHSASPAFDHAPALCLSGQIAFTEAFDVATPRIDFHKLWIAPPASGQVLPRIRVDGLGVGLSLGPNISIYGMGRAIDGTLPTIEGAPPPDSPVTGKGFLAEGSVRIKGFASLSASMGFLELERADHAEQRLAFFLYMQLEDISIPIETPIGDLFIRTIGFGFGYRYTLAGLAAADQATTPRQVVMLLDSIAKYQGNLDKVTSWSPTYDNSAATFALRMLVSIASSSAETQTTYDPDEDEIANLVLFDIVAALRTDLTFLMTVRLWIAYNYGDWRRASQKGGESWQSNPSLLGYMYLSAPNHEFLARAVYNPGAEIGNHPPMYEPLKRAMQLAHWSSTLYIRPGLFHQEFGWPYELGFDVGQPEDAFYLTVRGGTVLRYEDAALLYGLAFQARGAVTLAASSGGSFGASVSARADFSLAAKLIAYLALDAKDTLLYGTLSLDICVSFSVHVWLDAKFFHLSASFGVALTIHVGVELVIGGKEIGAHVDASVSVGAFGRSLTVGVSFTLDSQGALPDARARSARYLSLGLGCEYPDPTAGMPLATSAGGMPAASLGAPGATTPDRPAVALPLPATARGANAVLANQRVVDEALRAQTVNPDGDTSIDTVRDSQYLGVAFGPTDYWMLLFPVADPTGQKRMLLQFIPRDASGRIQRDAAGVLMRPASGLGISGAFFAAPRPGSPLPEYVITIDGVPGIPGDVVGLPPDPAVATMGDRRTRWIQPVGKPSIADLGCGAPTLEVLFDKSMFMAPSGPDYSLGNAPALQQEADAWLPTDEKSRNDVLADAARSRSVLGPRARRLLALEEARSSFVSMVGQSAAQLAQRLRFDAQGAPVLPDMSDLDFDPTALGLTFLVRPDQVDALQRASIGVSTRLPVQDGVMPAPADYVKGTARVFNPPALMFRTSPPRLSGRSWQLRPGGIQLYWDLEPRWSVDPGQVEDPRYHLQCYRIERRVLAEGSTPLQPPRRYTVAQSSPLKFDVATTADGCVCVSAQRLLHRLQFVDDLLDLPQELRAQILPSPDGPPDEVRDRIEIVYAILPVDAAQTSDLPVPWSIVLRPPQPVQPAVISATVRFRYVGDALPGLDAHAPTAGFLALSLVEPSSKPSEHNPALAPVLIRKPGDYVLRVRQEATISGGVFGADAVTQARSAPVPPDADQPCGRNEFDVTLQLASPQPGDLQVEVRRVPVPIAGQADAEGGAMQNTYVIRAAELPVLQQALGMGAAADGVAARIFVRPKADQDGAPVPWTATQLQLQLARPQAPVAAAGAPQATAADTVPVDVTVECFEHPRAVRYAAIERPRTVGSGRVVIALPSLKATAELPLCVPAADPAGRSGVRLSWDARSETLACLDTPTLAAANLQAWVGGFDVFGIDVAAVPAGVDVAAPSAADTTGSARRSLLSYATRVCRVQRLPASEAGQSPAETGNLAQVEAHYPSETRRATLLDGQGRAVRGKKALAHWYSGAETFLRWPEHMPRLSLCTRPEDVEIEALFAKGAPTTLRVALGSDQDRPQALLDLEGVVDATLFASLPLGIQIDAGNAATLAFKRATPNAAFTPNDVRRLVLALSLRPDTPFDLGDLPPTFRLEGWRDGATRQVRTGSALLRRSPQSKRHAVLADVLDLIEVVNLALTDDVAPDPSKPVYRRYETLIENAPPVHATGLAGFLDESGPDQDPSGWGALRALGFAASWRLYDVDAAAFVDGHQARSCLVMALKIVLPRYRLCADRIGTPFVDLLATTDVLSGAVGFDGGAGAFDANQIDRSALGLVQLELRPTAMPLAARTVPADTTVPVRYGRLVYTRGPDPVQATLSLLHKDLGTKLPDGVLLEIEPMLRGATERASRTLLRSAPDSADGAYTRTMVGCDARLPFPGDTENQVVDAYELPIPDVDPLLKTFPVAWVRCVCMTPGMDFSQLFTTYPNLSFVEDERPAVLLLPEAAPAQAESNSAWGRFAPLPAAWVAALTLGKGPAATGINIFAALRTALQTMATPAAPEAAPAGSAVTGRGDAADAAAKDAEQAARAAAVAAAKAAADAAFPLPTSPAERIALASRLAVWSQRFLDQGAADQVSIVDELAPLPVRVAVAMLTRPEPWRVAADGAGRLSVLLFEKDRFGKLRKYAVRPFGRYESLQLALVSTPDGTAPRTAADQAAWLALTRPDLRVPGMFGDQANFLVTHFADAVIERSEPLSPPVILGMRAQRPGAQSGSDPRSYIELAVSRHPQAMLSSANTVVDAGVAMRHIGVAFWRRFRDTSWLGRVAQALVLPPYDEAAAFGPYAGAGWTEATLPRPDDLLLDEDGNVHVDPVRGDDERHPDLYTGAHVLRMTDMPYGFKLYATAHVAAGAVVSPQSAAAVDGAPLVLAMPRSLPVDAAAGPWQRRSVPAPTYAILPFDPANQAVEFEVVWPLCRYVDGMTDDTRALWFGGLDAPAFYRAPDASIRYRLTLVSEMTLGQRERDPQVEFGSIKEPPPGAAPALYTAQALGRRYVAPTIAVATVLDTHLAATSRLRYVGDATPPIAPDFEAPTVAQFDAAALDLAAAAPEWAAWGALAPTCTRTFTITPPAPLPAPDPVAWQQSIQGLLDQIHAYDRDGMPGRARAVATQQIAKLLPFLVLAQVQAGLPASVDLPWMWGWTLTLTAAIQAAALPPAASWSWPHLESGGPLDGADGRAVVQQVLAGHAGTRDALVDALLRWTIGRLSAAEEQPVVGLRAIAIDLAAPIPGGLADQPMVELMQVLDLPAAAARTVADIDACLALLEKLPRSAQAMAVLARLRRAPATAAQLPMPWLPDPVPAQAWATALTQLGVASLTPVASRCIQRVPLGAAARQAFAATSQQLAQALETNSQVMLLGVGRTLALEAYAGDLPSISAPIEEQHA